MVEYDSKLIYEFAERAYKQAQTIVTTYAISGGAIGAAIGVLLVVFVTEPVAWWIMAAVGGAGGGWIGWTHGSEKAFKLKLDAQTALCQAKIEANTRPD